MTEQPPPRVRVTGPHAGRPRRTTVAAEIDAQTELGEVFMRSLLRTQLRLALLVLVLVVVTVGALPAAFVLVPGLRTATLWGLPVAWLALGVGVYPLLILLAWGYVRRAERAEADFHALTERR